MSFEAEHISAESSSTQLHHAGSCNLKHSSFLLSWRLEDNICIWVVKTLELQVQKINYSKEEKGNAQLEMIYSCLGKHDHAAFSCHSDPVWSQLMTAQEVNTHLPFDFAANLYHKCSQAVYACFKLSYIQICMLWNDIIPTCFLLLSCNLSLQCVLRHKWHMMDQKDLPFTSESW